MNPQKTTIKSQIVTNFTDKLGIPGSIPTEVLIETLDDIVDAIPEVGGLVPVDGDIQINNVKTFSSSPVIPDGIELQQAASIANIIQLPKDIRFQKLQRTIPDILVVTSGINKCKDFLRLVPANNYCFVKIYAVNQDSTVKTFEFSAGYDALNENTWSTLVPLTVYNDRGQDFNIEIKKVSGFGPTNFGIIFRYRNTTGTSTPSQASMKVEFGLRLPAVGTNYDQFNILTTAEYDLAGGTDVYGQKLTRTADGLNWIDTNGKKFLKEGDVTPVDISGKADKTYVDTQNQTLDAKFADYLPTSQKGVANGVATLGSDGKVPAQFLSAGAQVYKGVWNPATNTPALADGTGVAGWTYRVTVAGNINLGSGIINFLAGDDAIYNGTIWERNPDSLSVASVAGKTGDVVLNKADVGLSAVDNTSDANKPVSAAQATAIGQREPTIAAGTTAQFLRGDKTWQSFATNVLATVLAGLGGTNTPITSAMSLLTALGNLQVQITSAVNSLTSKANLVGGTVPLTEIPIIPLDKMESDDLGAKFNNVFEAPAGKLNILNTMTVSGVDRLFKLFASKKINEPLFLRTQDSTLSLVTSGRTYLGWHYFEQDEVVSYIDLIMRTAGAYTAVADRNKVVLYKYDETTKIATQVGISADTPNLFTAAPGTLVRTSLLANVNCTRGYYLIGFRYESSAQTIQPAIAGKTFGSSTVVQDAFADIPFYVTTAGLAFPATIDMNVVQSEAGGLIYLVIPERV